MDGLSLIVIWSFLYLFQYIFFPPKIKMGHLLANHLVSRAKFMKRLTIIRADKFLKSFENPRHRVENQFSGS